MMHYLRALAAEIMKLRRTPALWVVIGAPLVICGLFFAASLKLEQLPKPYTSAWEWVIRQIAMFWGLMILPMTVALLSGLLNAYEHQAESWKHLFALPIKRPAIYGAKLSIHHALLVLTSLLVVGGTVLLGIAAHAIRPQFGFSYDPPVAQLAGMMAKFYLASWVIVAILHYLATRVRNFSVTLGVGIAGTFIGMVQATGWWQKLFPWKLPMNTQAAVAGVPELALAVGIGGGLILTIAAIVDLSRREVL